MCNSPMAKMEIDEEESAPSLRTPDQKGNQERGSQRQVKGARKGQCLKKSRTDWRRRKRGASPFCYRRTRKKGKNPMLFSPEKKQKPKKGKSRGSSSRKNLSISCSGKPDPEER